MEAKIAGEHPCPLRRPLYFPSCLEDVDDRDYPSLQRYSETNGTLRPRIHWTLLCDVIDYQPFNVTGRPMVRCRDSAGKEFHVIGFFEGHRNYEFDRYVRPHLKSGRVLAFRYGEKTTFLDLSTGFRVEDHSAPMLKVMPGPLTELLAAGDVVFSEAARIWNCWCCGSHDNANASGAFRRCTHCELARYCSNECQINDWDAHKQVCKYVVHVNELIGRGIKPFTLDSFEDWVSFPRNGVEPAADPSRTDFQETKRALYKCNDCVRVFLSEESLQQHRQVKHVLFKCNDCVRVFLSEESLQQHRQVKHVLFKCNDCVRVFLSEESLQQHWRAKHVLFKCNDCVRVFRSEESLHQHRKAKHGISSGVRNSLKRPAGPPVPDLEGVWVPPSDFHGKKSFGFFTCPRCNNAWYSAHAFPKFKQGCKSCDIESWPQFLWQNASTRQWSQHESEKLKGPHQSERCEACRAGVCIQK